MERGWPAYAARGNLEARLGITLRFAVLEKVNLWMERRSPPIPATRLAWNIAALDSLIALAKCDGVELLIYKPPHRPGWKTFYHERGAYDRFFAELEARCVREGLHYLDLETIVPERYWGTTNTGLPDVFHFQDHGHRQLGRAIDDFLAEHGD